MVTKTVTYTTFTGVEKTRELLFHISKPELLDLEASVEGGLGEQIQTLQHTKDAFVAVSIFKKLLLASYGELSADGDSFMKTPEITKKFECSAAFEKIYMDFLENPEKAADFYEQLTPKFSEEEMKKIEAAKAKAENK